MKTQILRLDPHDDVISARDKMGWNQTARILLVWPDRGRILHRKLDLVILQRHSASLGAQLALITRDSEVLSNARQSGIPTFKSLKQAQRAHWRPERRYRVRRHFEKPKPSGSRADLRELRKTIHPASPKVLTHPATRLALFTLGVLALLSIAAVLLPTAVVILQPELQSQTIVIDIRAGPQFDAIHLSGAIPARPVVVIVEGRDRLETSGVVRVPDQFATGRVVFTNLTEQALQLPTGSIVRSLDSEPIRFATTQSGSLPPGPGEAITLTVRAVLPGEAGNLPENHPLALEGLLGVSLNVKNPAPTGGGTDRLLPRATQYNRERLFKLLEFALRKTAVDELQNRIPAGDILFTGTVSQTYILEAIYTPPVEIPSDELSLNLRLEYSALSVSGQDLEELALLSLNASLPHGLVPLPESIAIQNISEPVFHQGVARWQLRASRQVQPDLSDSTATNLILGTPPLIASSRLATELPLKETPMIIIVPGWWPRLPLLPFRITIHTVGSALN